MWLKVGVPVALALVVIGVLILAPRPKSDDDPSGPDVPQVTLPFTIPGDPSAPDPGLAAREVAGPFTGSAGRLTLVVEKIELRSDGLVFHILVRNGTRDTLTLPASRFSVIDNNGRNYEADPFRRAGPVSSRRGRPGGRSRWAEACRRVRRRSKSDGERCSAPWTLRSRTASSSRT